MTWWAAPSWQSLLGGNGHPILEHRHFASILPRSRKALPELPRLLQIHAFLFNLSRIILYSVWYQHLIQYFVHLISHLSQHHLGQSILCLTDQQCPPFSYTKCIYVYIAFLIVYVYFIPIPIPPYLNEFSFWHISPYILCSFLIDQVYCLCLSLPL